MYPGEQLVLFRIHYVNLGEKVLKPKGRCWGERRCDNRVIHPAPAGSHLRCALGEHIPQACGLLCCRSINTGNTFLTPRNTFGHSTGGEGRDVTPCPTAGAGWGPAGSVAQGFVRWVFVTQPQGPVLCFTSHCCGNPADGQAARVTVPAWPWGWQGWHLHIPCTERGSGPDRVQLPPRSFWRGN